MRFRLLTLALVLAACDGRAPHQAGEGLHFRGGVLELDRSAVPVLEACAPGQVVKKSAEGFECGVIDGQALGGDRLAALTGALTERVSRLQELQQQRRALTSSITRLEAERDRVMAEVDAELAGSSAQSFSVAAISCARAPEISRFGGYVEQDGIMRHGPGGGIDAHLYCPYFSLDPMPSLNALELAVHRPARDDEDVRAAMLASHATGGRIEMGFANVDRWRVTGFASVFGNLYAFGAQRNEPQHLDSAIYDPGNTATIGFIGARLFRRGPAEPPELAAPGGVLRIDLGSVTQRIEGNDLWHPDEPYLAPDHREASRVQITAVVDQSGLSRPRPPPSVFSFWRRCNCALEYLLRVPDGRYTVTTYYANFTNVALEETQTVTATGGALQLSVEAGQDDKRPCAMIIRREGA